MCYAVELIMNVLCCGIDNECVILWNWEWMCYTVELIMNVLYCGIDNGCVILWNW